MKVPSKVEGKTLNKKMRGKGHFRDAPKLPQSTYSGTACTQNPLPILTSGSTYSKMSERKAVIKNADMSEDMQQDAVDCATQVSDYYVQRGP